MITENQSGVSGVTNPDKGVARNVSGMEGECIVIPFRQTRSSDAQECRAPSRASSPPASVDEELQAHREEIPVVCIPWYAEAVRRHRCIPSPAPHWLRSALLMAVSTLYTAVAVAVCLSLE